MMVTRPSKLIELVHDLSIDNKHAEIADDFCILVDAPDV